jgi:hypothetical protein
MKFGVIDFDFEVEMSEYNWKNKKVGRREGEVGSGGNNGWSLDQV